MTIAEKLLLITENISKIFAKGYSKGYSEGASTAPQYPNAEEVAY